MSLDTVVFYKFLVKTTVILHAKSGTHNTSRSEVIGHIPAIF